MRSEPAADGVVRLRSAQLPGAVELPADGSADPRTVEPAWGRYAAGLLRSLAERGRAPVGIDATVSSTVPVGSGLSSSAALEVSLALALCDAASLTLPPHELALACQAADHALGVPAGIMDQLTSVAGRRGCALRRGSGCAPCATRRLSRSPASRAHVMWCPEFPTLTPRAAELREVVPEWSAPRPASCASVVRSALVRRQ